ncbi:MAG: DUF58 domain-containing protein [Anaerolineales bacterium]
MPRAAFLIFALSALLVAGLATMHSGLLALSMPLFVYLLAGLWQAPQNAYLTVHRTLSKGRVAPNEEVQVTLDVTNSGPDLSELLLEDRFPPSLTLRFGTPRRLLSLKRGASCSWTYTVKGPRGSYPFEAVHVEAADPFGLRPVCQEVHLRSDLFIFPPAAPLKRIPLRTRTTRPVAGAIPARVGGPGVEFFGLREYRPGDPPRWINWRASAHNDELFTNEFQQERVTDVGIVLDGREKTNSFPAGRSLFEYSVLAAAALAEAFLGQGNRVGLLHYGRYIDWTLPGYGKVQRERILQALAHARPGGSSVFSGLEYIPVRFFPAHSQVVLVSPLDAGDLGVLVQLRARGYQVMVVSPNPVAFELHFLPDQPNVRLAARIVDMERRLTLVRLQRAGIQVLDWDVSQPFDQVVEQRLGPPPPLLQIMRLHS